MTLKIDQRLQQGRYRIRDRLGQGGMGTVYLAEDFNLSGRLVAIKENTDASPEAQMQFQREAIMLASLTHANLPRVTDHFIEASGRQYLVMDYVQGDDLRELLREYGGPLPESLVLGWIEQVMSALAYMHNWIDPVTRKSSPVIHRDIKPGNIKRMPDGHVVLVDFGLAKFAEGSVTIQGARAVTPGYSPVEQYTGGTSVRSDIYALGATLYTLVTGQRPPESPAIAAGATLPAPRKVNPNITRTTERVILRAMQLQPAERYASIQEMRTALFTKRGTNPKPEKLVMPFEKETQRPPGQTAGNTQRRIGYRMGAVMLLLLLGVGGGIALFAPDLLDRLQLFNGTSLPTTALLPTDTPTLTSTETPAAPLPATITPNPIQAETTGEPLASAAPITSTAPLTVHATLTATVSLTPSVTATRLPTATATISATATSTAAPTPSATWTDTATPMPTATPSATASPSVTATPTPDQTLVAQQTKQAEQTAAALLRAATATANGTMFAEQTAQAALQQARAATLTAAPTTTPVPTLTPAATVTPTRSPTATATATATMTPAATKTLTPPPTVTATSTPTVNNTLIAEQTIHAEFVTMVASKRATLTAVALRPTNTMSPPTPTRSPTGTPTPTSTPSFTPTATATPAPTPLPTLPPTNTPAPTLPPTPQPTATPALPIGGSVSLLEPLDAVLNGRRTFRWSTNVVLGENQYFELVFWPAGQEPLAASFGPVGSIKETTVVVDLDKTADTLSHLFQSGHEYEWGVLLVELNPYRRLQYLGGGQHFRFEQSSGGGGGGGGGGDGGPPPTKTPRGD